MERGNESNPTSGEQRLVDYQVVQEIVDHEVQTTYLTFALFFLLSLTAAASLLVGLFGRELEHPTSFLIVSMGRIVDTTLAVWNWWFVTNRRQKVRTALFAYQERLPTS